MLFQQFCSVSYPLAKLPSFCSALKHAHSRTFSLQVSYPSATSLFFLPNGKTNTCTKGFSPSSVLLSPLTFLISIQFFSHLERVSSGPRICPSKKSPLKSQPCMVLYPLLSVLSLVHQFVQSLVAPILENLRRETKTSIKTPLLLAVAFWTLLFLFTWCWIHNMLTL